ncbi:MAG TPA: CBS domain-containing protein, partial [Anaerolineales bacterium]
MFTVRQLMQEKGDIGTYSISPQATVFEALKLMAERNVGAIAVVERGQMVGIFTERDYARKIILKGKCSLDTSLKDIMTTETIT